MCISKNNRLVKCECIVKDDARKIGNHHIGFMKNRKIVVVIIPAEQSGIGICLLEWLDDVFFRSE